jgi:hypothetical protein
MPRITILSASSGNGRCNALASSHRARIATFLVSANCSLSPTGLWQLSVTESAPGSRHYGEPAMRHYFFDLREEDDPVKDDEAFSLPR